MKDGRLRFRNDSGEKIPSYGIVQFDNTSAGENSREFLSAKQVSDATLAWGVNGPVEVDVNLPGGASHAFTPQWMAYDSSSGTPVKDDEWGPVAGNWKLAAQGQGVRIIAVRPDKELVLAQVIVFIDKTGSSTLPPGAGSCHCSKDCVNGVGGHQCNLCECINVRRRTAFPDIRPDFGPGEIWEEIKAVVDFDYWQECKWRTEEFDGPPCTDEYGAEIRDKYRVIYDFATKKATLTRTVDNGCPLITLIWQHCPDCEAQCQCPWNMMIAPGGFERVYVEECKLCITPMYKATGCCRIGFVKIKLVGNRVDGIEATRPDNDPAGTYCFRNDCWCSGDCSEIVDNCGAPYGTMQIASSGVSVIMQFYYFRTWGDPLSVLYELTITDGPVSGGYMCPVMGQTYVLVRTGSIGSADPSEYPDTIEITPQEWQTRASSSGAPGQRCGGTDPATTACGGGVQALLLNKDPDGSNISVSTIYSSCEQICEGVDCGADLTLADYQAWSEAGEDGDVLEVSCRCGSGIGYQGVPNGADLSYWRVVDGAWSLVYSSPGCTSPTAPLIDPAVVGEGVYSQGGCA